GSFANITRGNCVQSEGMSASLLVTISNSHVTLSNFLTNVPGDYNNNGIVDSADYVVWRKHVSTNAPLDNEVAIPGVTDQEDYDAWRANLGAASGFGSKLASLFPEPS